MSVSFSDAAKARQLRDFFARYGRVYIVVNATGDDVRIPPHLRGDPALRLILNQRMPQPIHIRDDALVSDFSFGGQAYSCHIPMHTIWAVYPAAGELEQGIVWEQDVPETIRALTQAARELAEQEEQQISSDETEGSEAQAQPELPGRKVRHLRIVK